MARLVSAKITNCPDCGSNDWLIWLTEEGDDDNAVPEDIASRMRMIDEMKKLRHQRRWGPFSPYLRKLEQQRDLEGPSASNKPRCARCGYERIAPEGSVEKAGGAE